MIPVRELRIDNLVLNDEGKLSKIVTIESNGCVILNNLEFWQPEAEWGQHELNLSGIPLTEEWLLKMSKSVQSFHDGVIIFHFEIFQAWSQGGSIWIQSKFDVQCSHIKYVHQLQNLFYALIGHELIIKEGKK